MAAAPQQDHRPTTTDGKTILVGIDGSEGSLRALHWALDEARLRGDAVEVIHAWHVPYLPDTTGMMPDSWTVLRDAADEVLAGTLATVAADAHDVSLTGRTEQGPGANPLIDASGSADLVVVGRRGHGELLSLVMGSVAEQVSGHAQCPVVIVA